MYQYYQSIQKGIVPPFLMKMCNSNLKKKKICSRLISDNFLTKEKIMSKISVINF